MRLGRHDLSLRRAAKLKFEMDASVVVVSRIPRPSPASREGGAGEARARDDAYGVARG
jgi:hypothetical protein